MVFIAMKPIYFTIIIFCCACSSGSQPSTTTTAGQQTTEEKDSSLPALFSRDQLKSQSFQLDAQKDFSIKGQKGTVLICKANSFVDEMGQVVKGNIDLQLTEAYTMVDFINGNLTTLHNGKALVSGGMLCITANQNGKTLQLKTDATIEVSAPNFKKQKNMSLFEGVVEGNTINWVNPVPIVPIPVAVAPSEEDFIELNPLDFNSQAEINVFPKDVDLPTEVQVIQHLPMPVRQKPKGVNSFSVDPETLNTFNFSVKKMGWANIDRLYSDRRSKPVNITTRIASDSFRDIYITMAIPELNMFIPGYQKADNTYGFSHNDAEQQVLPIGQKVYIIATARHKGQYYYCIQERNIQLKDDIVLNMQASSAEAVKQKMMDTFQ